MEIVDKVPSAARDLAVTDESGVNFRVLYLCCACIAAVLLVKVSSDLSLEVVSSVDSVESTHNAAKIAGRVLVMEFLTGTSGIVK